MSNPSAYSDSSKSNQEDRFESKAKNFSQKNVSKNIDDWKESDQFLVKRLKKTQREVKWVDFLSTLTALLTLGCLLFLIGVIFDHWVFSQGFSTRGRILYFGLVMTSLIACFLCRIYPIFFYRINPLYAAKVLEDNQEEVRNSVINWFLLRKEWKQNKKNPLSSSFQKTVLEGVVRQATNEIAAFPDQMTVDHMPLIRWGIAFVIVLFLFSGYSICSPKNPFPSIARILFPVADIKAPLSVRFIKIEPGNVKVFQNDRITIQAEISGVGNQPVYLSYSTIDQRFVDQKVEIPLKEGNLFELKFPDASEGLTESLNYQIVVGNPGRSENRSEIFSLEVRPAITFEVERLTLKYPQYSQMKEQILHHSGDINSLEGTAVEVVAHSNIPLKKALFVPDRIDRLAKVMTIDPTDSTCATYSFFLNPQKNQGNQSEKQPFSTYELRCVDEEGNKNLTPNVYQVVMIEDQSPQIVWETITQDDVSLPINQKLPLQLRANDPDFGLSSVCLRMTLREKQGDQERSLRVIPDEFSKIELLNNQQSNELSPQAGGDSEKSEEFIQNGLDEKQNLNLANNLFPKETLLHYDLIPENLGLRVGDEVEYWAEAVDNKTPEPNSATTEKRTFIVTEKSLSSENQNDDSNEESQGNDSGENGNQNDSSENQGKSEKEKQKSDESGDSQNDDSQNQSKTDSSDSEQKESESGDSENGQQKKDDSSEKNQNNEQNNSDGQEKNDNQQDQSSNNDQNESGKQDSNDQQNSQEQSSNEQKSNEGEGNSEKNPNDNSSSGGNQQENANEDQSDSQSEQNSSDNNNNSDSDQKNENNGQNKNSPNVPSNSEKNSDANNSSGDNSDSNDQNQKGENSDSSSKTGESSNQPIDPDANPGEAFEKILDQMKKTDKQNAANNSPSQGDLSESQEKDDNSSKTDSSNNKNPNSNDPNQEKQSPPLQNPNPNDSQKATESGDLPSLSGNESSEDDRIRANSVDHLDPGIKRQQGEIDPKTNTFMTTNQNPQDQLAAQPVDPNSSIVDDPDQNVEALPADDKTSKRLSNSSNSSKIDPNQMDILTQDDLNQNENESNNQDNQSSDSNNSLEHFNLDSLPDNAALGAGKSGDRPPIHLPKKSNEVGQSSGESEDSSTTPDKNRPDSQDQDSDFNRPDQNNSDSTKRGTGGYGTDREVVEEKIPFQADSPNLLFTEKATSLALQYLEDQVKNGPDQELMEQLGWNQEQLEAFLNKWKEMKKNAQEFGENSPERQYYLESLKDLGLQNSRSNDSILEKNRSNEFREQTTGQQTIRSKPPTSFEERFRAYHQGVSSKK